VTYSRTVLKFVVLAVALVSFYVGVAHGEWAETMFNATLL